MCKGIQNTDKNSLEDYHFVSCIGTSISEKFWLYSDDVIQCVL